MNNRSITFWNTLKDDLAERRTARAHRRQLADSLAHVSSPAEIEDILAAADRTGGPDAELVREILNIQLHDYYVHQRARFSA